MSKSVVETQHSKQCHNQHGIQKCATKPQDVLVLRRMLSAAVSIANVLELKVLGKLAAEGGMDPEDALKGLTEEHEQQQKIYVYDRETKWKLIHPLVPLPSAIKKRIPKLNGKKESLLFQTQFDLVQR